MEFANDNELLNAAISYATECHKDGVRKGTNMNYIVHPLEVMHILFLMGADKKLMAAGVLHDTVEDTDATLKDIKARFGEFVAELVKSHTEQHKEWEWEKRKITAMTSELTASRAEKLLVLADKLANIRAIHRDYESLGEELWGRFNRGKDQQAWYYHSSANALRSLADDTAAKEFYDEYVELVHATFGEAPENVLFK